MGPAGPVRVGDEVIAFRAPGAYAAGLVVPADALVPKPATLDWAPASGLMLTGVTAWHALVATDVHQGDTVLMHGAAGGVGIMAVQLAVRRGATVIGTARPGTSSSASWAPSRWPTATAWPAGSARPRPAAWMWRWT